jgi:hypothetical protein
MSDRIKNFRERATALRFEMNQIADEIDAALEILDVEEGVRALSPLARATESLIPLQGKGKALFDDVRRYQDLRWRALDLAKEVGLPLSDGKLETLINKLDRQ